MAKANAEDRQLVNRMLRGEEAAFSRFFERHFPSLFRFAMSRVGHDADLAEDVVQATLIQAIRKLSTFRGDAALFTWLCTFCRHEISANYRRRRRHIEHVSDDADALEAALERLEAADTDVPDNQLQREALRSEVLGLLDQLPHHYGQALTWKYLEDLPVREIAQRLDIGPKAAESLLTRARNAYRDAFEAASRLAGAQIPNEAG